MKINYFKTVFKIKTIRAPSTYIQYLSYNRLSSVTFSQEDIAKIIQNLHLGRVHGHDNISIRMLKICGSAICEPLAVIFKQRVDTGIFPSEWRKGNIVSIHKKCYKQTLKNYRRTYLIKPVWF